MVLESRGNGRSGGLARCVFIEVACFGADRVAGDGLADLPARLRPCAGLFCVGVGPSRSHPRGAPELAVDAGAGCLLVLCSWRTRSYSTRGFGRNFKTIVLSQHEGESAVAVDTWGEVGIVLSHVRVDRDE